MRTEGPKKTVFSNDGLVLMRRPSRSGSSSILRVLLLFCVAGWLVWVLLLRKSISKEVASPLASRVLLVRERLVKAERQLVDARKKAIGAPASVLKQIEARKQFLRGKIVPHAPNVVRIRD